MSFHVGQKVVCVDDRQLGQYATWVVKDFNLHGLKRGTVYTVRSVGKFYDTPSVWLQEIVRPIDGVWGEPPYSPMRFRPVVERKTSIEIFTRMLTPNKERVS